MVFNSGGVLSVIFYIPNGNYREIRGNFPADRTRWGEQKILGIYSNCSKKEVCEPEVYETVQKILYCVEKFTKICEM